LKLRTIGDGSSARREWDFDMAADGVLVLRVSGSLRTHDHLRCAVRNARVLAFDVEARG
jgi:hypothetical protein